MRFIQCNIITEGHVYIPTCDILLSVHLVSFDSQSIPVEVWPVPLKKLYAHQLVTVQEDTKRGLGNVRYHDHRPDHLGR